MKRREFIMLLGGAAGALAARAAGREQFIGAEPNTEWLSGQALLWTQRGSS
jgi:hypothetical protein